MRAFLSTGTCSRRSASTHMLSDSLWNATAIPVSGKKKKVVIAQPVPQGPIVLTPSFLADMIPKVIKVDERREEKKALYIEQAKEEVRERYAGASVCIICTLARGCAFEISSLGACRKSTVSSTDRHAWAVKLKGIFTFYCRGTLFPMQVCWQLLGKLSELCTQSQRTSVPSSGIQTRGRST